MQKKYLVAGLLTCTLALAGCKSKTSETSSSAQTSPATQEKSKENSATTNQMQSWIDAVKVGGGLSCKVTDTKNNTTTTYVAKGKKLHMIGINMGNDQAATSGEMLSDGAFVYTWDTKTKEGFKMALPSEEEMKNTQEQSPAAKAPDFSTEESIQKLEDSGVKLDCSPKTISDSEFTVPSDVKFQDFSTMMKNAAQSAQEGMSAEEKQQFEQMMKESEGQ